ncbi:hypothetical protein KEM54_000618 [Ascosphaera aggregata]|nr:hypothetical protein KEM54_000618 [Ascosphaera aggregata]
MYRQYVRHKTVLRLVVTLTVPSPKDSAEGWNFNLSKIGASGRLHWQASPIAELAQGIYKKADVRASHHENWSENKASDHSCFDNIFAIYYPENPGHLVRKARLKADTSHNGSFLEILWTQRQSAEPSNFYDCRPGLLVGCSPSLSQHQDGRHCTDESSLFGYDQGVTGGLLDMSSFVKHFEPIDRTKKHLALFRDPDAEDRKRSVYQGITVSSYNLGCFLGAIFTVFVGNRLGRRKTIFVGSIIMIIGAILQCTAFSLPHLVVGRVVTGWGNGMNTSTVPMWQSETAAAHHRGKLVMIEGMLVTGGITLSYWVDYAFVWIEEREVAWRFPLAFQIFFAAIIFLSIMNLPESPRWLVMQNRNEEALEVLSVISGLPEDDPHIAIELQNVQDTVEEMSKGSFRSLFVMTEYREFHRVVLACASQMYQQITGINLITYYAPDLYKKIDLNRNNYPQLLAACNGTEYLMSAFIPIFIIEKVGRRQLMIFGAVGQAISMAVLAGTNYRLTRPNKDSHAGVGQAVFLFVFNTFFGIGWLSTAWLYPAEIVPLKIRAPTNALSTSTNWIFNFMVVMISPVAFANIGYKTYVVFAVINAFIAPTVYLFFPETRRRSLEEMDDIFKKSSNVIDCVEVSQTEPFRYDERGQLKQEYMDASRYRKTSLLSGGGQAQHVVSEVDVENGWDEKPGQGESTPEFEADELAFDLGSLSARNSKV